MFVLYSLYADPDIFDAYLASDGSFDWDNKIVEIELARMFVADKALKKYVHFTSSHLVNVEPEFDSLADAYMEAGSLIEAIRSVRKSVVLATQFKDPNLKYFNEKLTKLDTKFGKYEDKSLQP